MTPAAAGWLFVAINIALWLLVLAVQTLESRQGWIPPRRAWGEPGAFLYFQDWRMATWGDWIGLSLIDWTAGNALAIGATAHAMVVAAIAIAAAGTAFFHIRCLYFHHRPDAGYPRHGTASLSGLAHLVYFFLQCVACALALLAALGGTIPSALIATAIAGALVYLASFAADWKAGKLRPEKI